MDRGGLMQRCCDRKGAAPRRESMRVCHLVAGLLPYVYALGAGRVVALKTAAEIKNHPLLNRYGPSTEH
ncbi:MAG TPA: hypothetical protein VLA19_15455 [Herpetosiphonaceae bacterium]|nr:hypothetical protein [Herpetosiphonaceae bacterium]